jgi:hypothetical protein
MPPLHASRCVDTRLLPALDRSAGRNPVSRRIAVTAGPASRCEIPIHRCRLVRDSPDSASRAGPQDW